MVTFYNKTRDSVNTIRQSLIKWLLWRSSVSSLGRGLVAAAVVKRCTLVEVRLYSIRENVKEHKLATTLKRVKVAVGGDRGEHFTE